MIEAPTSFEFLIQSLQDQATEPPIAIFAQAQSHHNGSPSRAQQDEQHQANQSQPEFFLPISLFVNIHQNGWRFKRQNNNMQKLSLLTWIGLSKAF